MLMRGVVWCCLIGGLLAPLPALAEKAKARTISVSASGYVMAQPDMAQIGIGVTTEANSAKAALEQNSEVFQAVLAGLKKLGIAAKDIATAQFQVNPIYARRKSSGGYSRNKIDGFRVHNKATVTVRDIKQIGPVIDRAAELGGNEIGAIRFVVSDLETKLDEARRAAMRNAVRRAKLYAEAGDAKLGAIQTISEQFHGQPRPVQFGRAAKMSAPAPIEPGQRRLGVTVHAVWELD